MRIEEIKEIANAVLYEGYLLYPYRHSAIKNRQRWTYGVVYPREYSEANGGVEPWTMLTECLVAGSADTSLDISIRFLHLLMCRVMQSEAMSAPSQANGEELRTAEWSLASQFTNEPWEEGVEREVNILNLSLSDLLDHPRIVEIEFPGRRIEEDPIDTSAAVVREQQALVGAALIAAERALRVHQGTFISLMDPPEALKAITQGCQNLHTWPVLVGKEGECDAMLSSPIILYDYPQIAPESPGSLFDGTEIDEILTLRIMTLTDEEKQEMRQGDERVREILERTEALSPEQFMKLHGVIRSLRPIDDGEGT